MQPIQGTLFTAASKVHPTPRAFEIVDVRDSGTYNITIRELGTSELSDVESEWFNQRKIVQL